MDVRRSGAVVQRPVRHEAGIRLVVQRRRARDIGIGRFTIGVFRAYFVVVGGIDRTRRVLESGAVHRGNVDFRKGYPCYPWNARFRSRLLLLELSVQARLICTAETGCAVSPVGAAGGEVAMGREAKNSRPPACTHYVELFLLAIVGTVNLTPVRED